MLKAHRIEATREMLARGYSPHQVILWLEAESGDKHWKVGRSTARGYVDRALETMESEVAAPKSRKQARVRAMLTMFAQRAYELAMEPGHAKHAAALITAGVAALDKIARVDGSYEFDGATELPSSINPATPEEAVRIVDHAQATIRLALKRGAMTAKPPVIETTAIAVDEDDDGPGVPIEPGDDAN